MNVPFFDDITGCPPQRPRKALWDKEAAQGFFAQLCRTSRCFLPSARSALYRHIYLAIPCFLGRLLVTLTLKPGLRGLVRSVVLPFDFYETRPVPAAPATLRRWNLFCHLRQVTLVATTAATTTTGSTSTAAASSRTVFTTVTDTTTTAVTAASTTAAQGGGGVLVAPGAIIEDEEEQEYRYQGATLAAAYGLSAAAGAGYEYQHDHQLLYLQVQRKQQQEASRRRRAAMTLRLLSRLLALIHGHPLLPPSSSSPSSSPDDEDQDQHDPGIYHRRGDGNRVASPADLYLVNPDTVFAATSPSVTGLCLRGLPATPLYAYFAGVWGGDGGGRDGGRDGEGEGEGEGESSEGDDGDGNVIDAFALEQLHGGRAECAFIGLFFLFCFFPFLYFYTLSSTLGTYLFNKPPSFPHHLFSPDNVLPSPSTLPHPMSHCTE
ncbi:hypothetical protein GGR56DRAFT_258906 [Xylariaceae sp. FL0804]|nr:hypothetical protein GGR56DRAFT_258906 [Xylariaceae sp. FL0804]